MPHEALYYPYTGISSADTLKKAMLYFDKIKIFDPYQSPSEFKINFDFTTLDKLNGEGIIDYIATETFRDQHKNDIIGSVLEDLEDESYTEFCRRYGKNESWGIGVARLPDDLDFRERMQIIRRIRSVSKFLFRKVNLC
jgi:hypothetical protein